MNELLEVLKLDWMEIKTLSCENSCEALDWPIFLGLNFLICIMGMLACTPEGLLWKLNKVVM